MALFMDTPNKYLVANDFEPAQKKKERKKKKKKEKKYEADSTGRKE